MVPREKPAGWFLGAMDYSDVMNPAIRNAGIYLIYEHLCAGGVVICSPFHTEISEKVYPGVGFRIIESATHYNYDGKTATPTYALDTRGDKLRAFMEDLFHKAGMKWQQAEQEKIGAAEAQIVRKAMMMEQLTKREQEVAKLVLAGFSNVEVAGKLFVSEVTVKKHLQAVYTKLGINSRMQLATKMLTE
ncbi:response regulator transcription factor [Paenibacillus sp. SI8]|uniref:response regulator transcription factor n=1 Tax=unclassified Paenibacillus TaxID=185978 RepID=UPI003465A452